jgi:hypothetical protein
MADNEKRIREEALKTASIVKDALDQISGDISDIFEKALGNVEGIASKTLKTVKRELTNFADVSRNISDINIKASEGLLKQKDLTREINKRKSQMFGLDTQINILKSNTIKLDEEELKLLNDLEQKRGELNAYNEEYTKELEKQLKYSDNINKSINATGVGLSVLSKLSSKIGLRGLDDAFDKAKKASIEKAKKLGADENKSLGIGDKFKVAGSAIGSLASSFGSFLKGPIWITALVEAFKFIKDAMLAADERVTKLAKGLMISKDAARAIYSSFTDSKSEIDSIYRTTKDITEAFTDLTELTEFVTVSSMKMVEAQIILTKNLGLSKEQAFGVQEAFANSNIEADKGTDIVYDQIAAFANQNKLLSTGKVIFNDIAKTSKLIQVNFKGNLGALTKTTLEAKKLGLTLDQVSKIGGSLLNFEESISAELEAELLTGKDLNLEKARAYALNHDIAGLAQEITNQGFTQEEFANYNVIQQEAIAKAYGMQAEEMADMLYKAKVLDKVGGQTLKNLRERANVLHEQGKETEAINLRNTIAQLEQGILSGKTLEQAEKANTAQEKFNQALEQAKEVFTDFVTGDYLDQLADAIVKFSELVLGAEGREKSAAKTAQKIKESEEYKSFTPEQKEKISKDEDIAMTQQVGIFDYIKSAAFGFLGPILMKKVDEQAQTASQNLENTLEDINVKKEKSITSPQPKVTPTKDTTIRTPGENNTAGNGATASNQMNEMIKLQTQQNQQLAQQNILLADIKDKKSYIGINGTVFGTTQENNSFVVS